MNNNFFILVLCCFFASSSLIHVLQYTNNPSPLRRFSWYQRVKNLRPSVHLPPCLSNSSSIPLSLSESPLRSSVVYQPEFRFPFTAANLKRYRHWLLATDGGLSLIASNGVNIQHTSLHREDIISANLQLPSYLSPICIISAFTSTNSYNSPDFGLNLHRLLLYNEDIFLVNSRYEASGVKLQHLGFLQSQLSLNRQQSTTASPDFVIATKLCPSDYVLQLFCEITVTSTDSPPP